MKILLIQPRMNKRPMDTDLKVRMAPSMALLTLVSLTPPGHEIRIVNENVEKFTADCAADLVGITVTLDVMPRTCQIAQAFRARGIPVVAGGIHVTCSPQACQPHFDALCIGPAERVWGNILLDAQAGRLQRQYSDMEGFEGAEIASPAYHYLDQPKYLFTNVVSTSRGCPHRCSFCYNSCPRSFYVRRPISDVLRDIRALGTRHVLFIDDNFIGSPAYAHELVQALEGMHLCWSAAVTAGIVHQPELLDRMAHSGCQNLFIGFESINPSSLESVRKANRVDRYEKVIEAIHSRGMMVNASMVFGLDGDDPATFQRTLDWLVKMKVETLTSHILTPYPGTALYRQMEEAGRIVDHDLSKYNTSHVVFAPKGMTAAELEQGYRWIYRRFYSLGNILRRMPVDKRQRHAYLMFNLLYRKYGKITSALARLVPMRVLGRLGAWLSYRVR